MKRSRPEDQERFESPTMEEICQELDRLEQAERAYCEDAYCACHDHGPEQHETLLNYGGNTDLSVWEMQVVGVSTLYPN